MRKSYIVLGLICAFGCQTPNKSTNTSAPTDTLVSMLDSPKSFSKIDFEGKGRRPSWRLTVDFDGEAYLYLGKKDTISLDGSAFVLEKGNASWNEESSTINITPKPCDDGSHSIEINYKGKEYSGCGSFINKNYELLGEWVFPEQDSTESSQAIIHFKDRKKVIGNDGCNQFFGHYSASTSELSFQAISATKKSCKNTKQVEVLGQLDAVTDYEIQSNTLLLLNGERTLMRLKRKTNE